MLMQYVTEESCEKMKSVYRLLFDIGETADITATCRANAIAHYCAEHGTYLDWVKSHCKIVNLGVAK